MIFFSEKWSVTVMADMQTPDVSVTEQRHRDDVIQPAETFGINKVSAQRETIGTHEHVTVNDEGGEEEETAEAMEEFIVSSDVRENSLISRL